MTISPASFNFLTAGAVACGLFLAALLNVMIDPFELYMVFEKNGINAQKPELAFHGRLTKAVAIERKQPTSIVLGSSRAALGINPLLIRTNPSECVYNCGLDSATMYEARRYFEHALVNQPHLRCVVIGLDYQMFDQSKRPPEEFVESRLCRTSMTSKDLLDTLLSIDACQASLSTFASNLMHPLADQSYFNANGQRNELAYLQSPLIGRWRSSIGAERSVPAKLAYSAAAMDDLRRVVETCRARGIQLQLFVSPSHAVEWESLRANGQWDNFCKWKNELAQIFPFWDFSGYSSITTEPLSDHMKFYVDASHYRDIVGGFIIAKLFSRESAAPRDFGRHCDGTNLGAINAQIEEARRTWLESQPDMRHCIASLRLPEDAEQLFGVAGRKRVAQIMVAPGLQKLKSDTGK